MSDNPSTPEQPQPVSLFQHCLQQESVGVPIDWKSVATSLFQANQAVQQELRHVDAQREAAEARVTELDGYNRDLEGDIQELEELVAKLEADQAELDHADNDE